MAPYQDNLQPHPRAFPTRSAQPPITASRTLPPPRPPLSIPPCPTPYLLLHTPHPPAFPGPWPHLPPDHLALFSLLVSLLLPSLLAPALPGAAVVLFLPEKGPHGNRNVQRDEKAAAAETAGTEGAPRGGGDPEDNWNLLNGRGRRGPLGEGRSRRRRERDRGVCETMERAW